MPGFTSSDSYCRITRTKTISVFQESWINCVSRSPTQSVYGGWAPLVYAVSSSSW